MIRPSGTNASCRNILETKSAPQMLFTQTLRFSTERSDLAVWPYVESQNLFLAVRFLDPAGRTFTLRSGSLPQLQIRTGFQSLDRSSLPFRIDYGSFPPNGTYNINEWEP
jgi:hypothetical protein